MTDFAPSVFAGTKVIVSEYAVNVERYTVCRTWRDRLLSWQWHPWLRTREEQRHVPAILQFHDGTLAIHPQQYAALKNVLEPPAADLPQQDTETR